MSSSVQQSGLVETDTSLLREQLYTTVGVLDPWVSVIYNDSLCSSRSPDEE